MGLNRENIRAWIRQARFRSKTDKSKCNLTPDEAMVVIEFYKHQCAYCDTVAYTLDRPFPPSESVPTVAANILPICKKCKSLKKVKDIMWMYAEHLLSEDRYLVLLRDMFLRSGGEIIKDHVRRLSGID